MTGAAAGRLLCLGGPPGAGKSTVGALLARAGAAALVDLDAVSTPLVEAVAALLGESADLDAPRFVGLREARYGCLAAVVTDCLRSGVDVVAVAPFSQEARDGAMWGSWGARLGARSTTTCWLDLPPAVAAARLRARGLPRDLARRSAPPPSAVDRGGVDLVLDASGTAQALAATVLAGWAVP